MTIYRGPGGSGDATNDATVTAVAAYAAQAATSATNAADSATASGTSATNSANSASSAAASASAAANSASQAASSQSAAATSATTAASSATSAGTQATNATTQANNAANSATAAATSASTATTKAAEAETYAIRAETAETNAETAYANTLAIYGDTTDVANAVASANTAASNAATSASQAAESANDASDEATQAGIYAGQAASSASAAANSAANSQAAVGDALALYGSAAALQTAVTNAQTSATQSANSATASSASSSAAQTSANAAATSATNAANSATQAANSAASAAAIVTGVASNRPSIRPSLLLDFQYTKQLDPRITFSRPTTATYYDGKTVVKAEENLLLWSQEFDNAAWNKINSGTGSSAPVVTPNAALAPDGTMTADRVVFTGGSDYSLLTSPAATVSGSGTFSLYVQSATGLAQQIVLYWHGGAVNRTLVDVPAFGWARVTLPITVSATDSVKMGIQRLFYPAVTSADVYIWGAQLEQRNTVTAYTPTTTAPSTNYIPALQTAVSNDARFDHDPVTGESKGLLIEEQRTNLLTYSEQFDNAAWNNKEKIDVSLDVLVAPNGSQSAEAVQANTTTSGTHRVSRNYTYATSSYTFSVYAKAGNGGRNLMLDAWDRTTSFGACFNLQTGSYVGTADYLTAPSAYSISSVGNGWYRCSITFTATANASAGDISIRMASGTSWAYAAATSDSIYIWGAQLEAGSFPTSYIPTVASQVTRSADSASMTGSNFSSWFNEAEGTLYTDAISYAGVPLGRTVMLGDSSGSAGITLGFRMSGSTLNTWIEAFNGSNPYINVYSTGGNDSKIAFGHSTNAAARAIDGTTTDTSGVLFSYTKGMTALGIGRAASYISQQHNGTIKRIAYYPKRLSNAELQGLTS